MRLTMEWWSVFFLFLSVSLTSLWELNLRSFSYFVFQHILTFLLPTLPKFFSNANFSLLNWFRHNLKLISSCLNFCRPTPQILHGRGFRIYCKLDKCNTTLGMFPKIGSNGFISIVGKSCQFLVVQM